MPEPYHITKDQNIKTLYTSIKSRVGKFGKYKNRKLLISWPVFYRFVRENKEYDKIFKTWQEHNYWHSLSPTIDRIDNDGDYSLDNIQILTRMDNTKKGDRLGIKNQRTETKIHLMDKRNELVVNLKEQGYNNEQIANIFNMNRSTIKRIDDNFVILEKTNRYKKFLSKELLSNKKPVRK